jgi:hypothetical protein
MSAKADGSIIAGLGDALKGHVAGSLDGPFVVLLEQQSADETGDGGFVGEDADDFGAALDLAIEALDRVGRVQLGAVLGREGHVGQDVGLGVVHYLASFGSLGRSWSAMRRHCRLAASASFCANAVPMKAETTRRPLLPACARAFAHEVHAAALPGRGEDLRDGGLDALVRVGDHQLDAAQPRRASWRRNSVQKVSASEAPIAMPSTSRRPSVLTPTAMITATETMRPFWRTFT